MAGRGATTFQKRQKEQQRRDKRAEKLARRAERKQNPIGGNEIAKPDEVRELIPVSDELAQSPQL